MKKVLLLISLILFAGNYANSKVSFKDWMTKGLLHNIKETKKEKEVERTLKNFQEDDSDQEGIEAFNVFDSQYEWSQFDNKNASAIMNEYGLLLKSKNNNSSSISIIELPIDVENDNFTYGVYAMWLSKNKEGGIGLVFDYEDNHNYKAIIINQKNYDYVNVKNNDIHVVKSGLVKISSKEKNKGFNGNKGLLYLEIKKEGDVIKFFINDVEFGKFKNVKINNNNFGIITVGKQELLVPKFFFMTGEMENEEESTTEF